MSKGKQGGKGGLQGKKEGTGRSFYLHRQRAKPFTMERQRFKRSPGRTGEERKRTRVEEATVKLVEHARPQVLGRRFQLLPELDLARRQEEWSANKRLFAEALKPIMSTERGFNGLQFLGKGSEGEVRMLVLGQPVMDALGHPRQHLAIKKFSKGKRRARNQIITLAKLSVVLEYLKARGRLQGMPPVSALMPLCEVGGTWLLMPCIRYAYRPAAYYRQAMPRVYESVQSVSFRLGRAILAETKSKVGRVPEGRKVVTPDLRPENMLVKVDSKGNIRDVLIIDQFATGINDRVVTGSDDNIVRKGKAGKG